jgi:hypothetical protein
MGHGLGHGFQDSFFPLQIFSEIGKAGNCAHMQLSPKIESPRQKGSPLCQDAIVRMTLTVYAAGGRPVPSKKREGRQSNGGPPFFWLFLISEDLRR